MPSVFQAFKFLRDKPDLAKRIRHCQGPHDALQEATRLRFHQRQDWFDVNIRVMDQVLELKFTQHPQLCDMLLSTRDAALVEDSSIDAFWGVGKDRQGRNELGKALMRLRERLYPKI
jgi:ribA/ribD-fused uncharacterized protein